MALKHNKKVILLPLILLIAACSNSNNSDSAIDGSEDSIIKPSETNAETDESSYELANSEPNSSKKNLSSYSMPLKDYIDINELVSERDINSRDFFTPLFIAKTTRKISDQDKLNLMSAEYFNEQDVFKKKDMEDTLLSEIDNEINKYKGDYGIKVPIGVPEAVSLQDVSENGLPIMTQNFNLSSYDFEKQEFPIHVCETDYDNLLKILNIDELKNSQNITLKFLSPAPKEASYDSKTVIPISHSIQYEGISCGLEVTNESLARKIEGLMTNDKVGTGIGTKGYVYYQIKADSNNLLAYPTYAHIAYFNENNGKELASKELNWSPDNEFN